MHTGIRGRVEHRAGDVSAGYGSRDTRLPQQGLQNRAADAPFGRHHFRGQVAEDVRMGVRVAADDVTGGPQRSDVRGLQEGSLTDPGGHDEEMRAPSPLLELLGAIESARTAVIESEQHMPAMVQASEVDVRDQFRRDWTLGNGV